jgi:hypothetical protein
MYWLPHVVRELSEVYMLSTQTMRNSRGCVHTRNLKIVFDLQFTDNDVLVPSNAS